MMDTDCTAKIVEVLNRYPNGSTDILVRGMKKYEFIHSSVLQRQYILGEIEYFDEDFEYPDTNLFEECVCLYNEIVEEIKSLFWDKVESSIFYSVTSSYSFVEKAGMTIEQKYNLLQLNSENLCVKYLVEHLKDVEPILRQAETIQKLIKNDGYGKRF
jgi:hypothetical protein